MKRTILAERIAGNREAKIVSERDTMSLVVSLNGYQSTSVSVDDALLRMIADVIAEAGLAAQEKETQA